MKYYPYGVCRVCNAEILIPGLDAYRCGGSCQGWVKVKKCQDWQELNKSLPKSIQRTSLVYQLPQSQLALELGGEAR